ncbi:hypothetical protein BDV96DRAFT_373268 [Lophiotrema nucula]|uniref:PD-(D/E)XK nuclease-like domain-containing protein n=1 Tax=Lophiotrema nucula TaxID=690887 RepID=A0A6A5YDZ0_9PLEO|nr:hypothetical protein BDV96DRAFT_373268 [Lophiotrema nucula]
MPTSPPLSPSLTREQRTHISSWLAQLIPSPDFSTQKSRKGKHAASEPPPILTHLPSPSYSPTPAVAMSTERSQSPNKRARIDDEVVPGESISVVLRPLEELSTFSPPVTQASKTPRSSSPSRETVVNLQFAKPPILTEAFNGATHPIPQRVWDIMYRLQPDNVERWVPASLKESIMGDSELGLQQISKGAWDPDCPDPVVDQYTLAAVKDIFLCARHCTAKGRDENAWCAEVVRPLLELALRLSDTKDLMVQSVCVIPIHSSVTTSRIKLTIALASQSQAINPTYLSAPASSSAMRPKPLISRKADFTLSYSDKTPTFRTLYAGIREQGYAEVSHMTDAYTQETPLFTAIEVKASDGIKPQGQYQLSVWLAASLRKKAELARAAGLMDTTNLVEPAFVVVGHEWYFYLGYLLLNGNGATIILQQGSCLTDSISGIFKLLRVLTGVVEYGLGGTGEKEGDGLWGAFLGVVLERLAGLREKDHVAEVS